MEDRVWQPPQDQLRAYPSTTGMIQSSSSVHGSNIIRRDYGGYDMPLPAELDQALLLYLDGQDQSSVQEQLQTLNIFPSMPMHVEPSSKGSMTSGPDVAGPSKKPPSRATGEPLALGKDTKATIKKEGRGKGSTVSSSEHEGPKTPDPKILRRLAQNREAARKSRLRKKAYIQQLESSRIKLSQLEEQHRARTQDVILGGGAVLGDQSGHPGSGGLSSEAAMFNVDYKRWLGEHHKMMFQLRAAVEDESLPEARLRLCADGAASHYGMLVGLKAGLAKSDVFHLLSGGWATPAERCFLWIAGFRPSELMKIVVRHVEPLTEQQLMGMYGVQQWCKQREDQLDRGFGALHRSLSDIISSDALQPTGPSDMASYMGHMSLAMANLTSLEVFVNQADELRLLTLQRLPEILTARQSARCLLAVGEYFHRLRALSSLWINRPRQDPGRP